MATKKNIKNDINEEIINIKENESKTKKDNLGKVTTNLLNVRKEPDINSVILDIIKKDTIVKINFEKSDDIFYKVYANNINGYCMKEYIEVL